MADKVNPERVFHAIALILTNRHEGYKVTVKEIRRIERKDEEKRAERELIRKSLQAVLASEDATPAEKLESSKLLLELDRRA